MNEDLLRRLEELEEDFPSQPTVARKADLVEINRLRALLKLPSINEYDIGVKTTEVTVPCNVPEEKADHSEAEAIYQAYLNKLAFLKPHQEYANKIAKATYGYNRTPVKPLAKMGTNGGPLLCDYCKKPMILEGNGFDGMYADRAWKKNPCNEWESFIKGGMVVDILTNETLRIYHGYIGNKDHCCDLASAERKAAFEEHDNSPGDDKIDILIAYIKHKFPNNSEKEREDLLNRILQMMYQYDPGIGINRPD